VLKTGHNFDGDSLSYLDMMERNSEEERRKVITVFHAFLVDQNDPDPIVLIFRIRIPPSFNYDKNCFIKKTY
jgi:hypothetical protein